MHSRHCTTKKPHQYHLRVHVPVMSDCMCAESWNWCTYGPKSTNFLYHFTKAANGEVAAMKTQSNVELSLNKCNVFTFLTLNKCCHEWLTEWDPELLVGLCAGNLLFTAALQRKIPWILVGQKKLDHHSQYRDCDSSLHSMNRQIFVFEVTYMNEGKSLTQTKKRLFVCAFIACIMWPDARCLI